MNFLPILVFTATGLPLGWAQTVGCPIGTGPSNAFCAEYYDNADLTNLKLTRTDSAVNFDWGTGSPDPSIAPDGFSVYWRGMMDFDAATYEFTAITDDGMRIWIDRAPVLEKWFDQSQTVYTFQLPMTAGSHYVEVQYYENAGSARAGFSWAKRPQYVIMHPADNCPTVMDRNMAQEIVNKMGRGSAARRLGFTVVLCTLTDSQATIGANLDSAMQESERLDLPLLIHATNEGWGSQGKNWWNWWDPSDPATYNPANVDNVEWDDWNTPQKSCPRYGGVFTTPCWNIESPALRAEWKKQSAFIASKVNAWRAHLQQIGKTELFAGVDAGWETDIPAADGKANQPRGYGVLRLRGFSASNPPADMNGELSRAVQQAAEFEARMLADEGIPKSRIYTHICCIDHGYPLSYSPVWTAFNPYSRPGFSLYQNYDKNKFAAAVNGYRYARIETDWRDIVYDFSQPGLDLVSLYVWGSGMPPSGGIASAISMDPTAQATILSVTGTGYIPPPPPPPAPDATCSGTWSLAKNLGGASPQDPAVEDFNGRLVVAVQGTDNAVYFSEWNDAGVHLPWYQTAGFTLERPKLAVQNNELWVYVVGATSGRVWKSRYLGPGTWSGWQDTGLSGTQLNGTGPGAVTAGYNGATYRATRTGATPIIEKCVANPIGWHDASDCNVTFGWTCDPDNYGLPLAVHLYRDGPAGSGTLLAAVTADLVREPAVGTLCGGNANHGFSFPTPTSLKDGQSHSIYAYAINIDAAGNHSGTNPLLSGLPKTFACAPPDSTPPVVSITSPANGTTVSGTVNVSANATDNVGVSKVEFYVDGTLKATKTASPYGFAWDTTQAPNGAHTLLTKAFDLAGNAGQAGVSVTVDNTAPIIANIVASQISSSSAAVTWTTNEPADSQVEYGTSTAYGQMSPLGKSLVTSHSQNLAGLLTAATYYCRVLSRDAAGNLAVSSGLVFRTLDLLDTTPPSVPASLTAVAVSSTQIDLSWSPSTDDNVGVAGYTVGMAGYKVFRDGAQVATRTVTIYSDTGLSPSTTYTYAVSAFDAAGNVSALSTPAGTRTLAAPDLTPPTVLITNPTAGTTVLGTVNVTANASDNMGVARVVFYVDGMAKSTDTTSPYGYGWDTSSLPNGSQHVLSAQAFDAAGNTAVSAAVTVTVANSASLPTGLKIVAPTGGGIYLGAYNQSNGVLEFEQTVGRKVAIFPSAFDCADGGTEGTLPKIDIPCRETRRQQGYVSSYSIEVIAGGLFTNQDIVAGKIDVELKQVARDIANWGRPILWFYQREPGGQFYCPVCTDSGKPQLYIAVHRRIHDVVENEIKAIGKISNITWVMGGIIEYAMPGFYTAYYPGDAYVDWHAFDWYPWPPTQYVSLSTYPGWKEAMSLAPQKPVLLMEFGVAGNTIATDVPGGSNTPAPIDHAMRTAWFQAFFNDVRTNPQMKNLAAFLYWQDAFSRLSSGIPEGQAWRQEIQAYPNFWHSQVFTSSGPALAPDTTPPSVSITLPADGATVSGTVNVAVNASDNVGVSRVVFSVDGVAKSTDTTGPYGFAWDTTQASNGAHTLLTNAFDAAGNAGQAGVSVTVANSASLPTGLKIVAPKGGGIYLGSFSDLGLYFQIAGNYDGSALPASEQPLYYGQNLDQMFGRKLAVRANALSLPFLQDEGLAVEGGGPGRLHFDAVGHKRAVEQYGYTTRYTLGDIYRAQYVQEIVQGLWDGKIDALAQSIRDYPYPVFFNYWIEADTSRIPQAEAPTFIVALRRIHDRIEALAPGKVTWVAPTVVVGPNVRESQVYPIYYPGDAYVDWHGFSFFCFNEDTTLYGPAKLCLDNMRTLLQGMTAKPVMFEQFGLVRGGVFSARTDQERAAWYQDFLREVKNYPEVAAILWVQNDYGNWNSALKVAEPAVAVIRNEIAANPGYWHSSVKTSSGSTPAPDTTPPTVSITNPANGATVSSIVGIAATASDNVGVARVVFFVDNVAVSTDAASPYGFPWDSTSVPNGSHTLTARAYDAAGNSAQHQVALTVSNSTPPPPAGLKIVAPPGGGIYMGAFNDLGLRYKVTGNYDGSVLSQAELPLFYSQDLSTMFGKQIAIARSGPYACADKSFSFGDTGGIPAFAFNRPCHERMFQDGYTSVLAMGDDARCGQGFATCGMRFFQDLAAGAYDALLTAAANEIRQFRHPLFMVMWIEADHNLGFDPVADPSGAAAFRQAMRHVHDLFESIDPGHLTWVAPTFGNTNVGSPTAAYAATYPGDAYVDWHGFSFYCLDPAVQGYGNPDTCLRKVREAIGRIGTAAANSKPVVFEQFGLIRGGGPEVLAQPDSAREQWYRDFFRVYKNYPELASLWWVQNDYPGWNSALKVAEPAVAVIRNEIAANPGYWYSQVQTSSGTGRGTDTTPPRVRILAPGEGWMVAGLVTIQADASDDTGISRIELYVDGSGLAVLTQQPYAYRWDASALPGTSTHTLTALAFDPAGNRGQAEVHVTVCNAAACSWPVPSIGGEMRDTLRGLRLAVPPGALSGAGGAVVSVRAEDRGDPYRESRRALSAAALGLERVRDGIEIETRASLAAPVTLGMTLPDCSGREVSLYRWEDSLDIWEEAAGTAVDLARCEAVASVSHFSTYAPFYKPAGSGSRMGEVYVFPNPARSGDKPSFHIEALQAEQVSLRIYDVAGSLVENQTLAGPPRLIQRGGRVAYAYEYTWESPRAGSGVYFYVVEARGRSGVEKRKGKFVRIQ